MHNTSASIQLLMLIIQHLRHVVNSSKGQVYLLGRIIHETLVVLLSYLHTSFGYLKSIYTFAPHLYSHISFNLNPSMMLKELVFLVEFAMI